MAIQKLHLVSATFPPQVCGVADHTAYLSMELAKTVEVKVLTACTQVDSLTNIKVDCAFRREQLSSCLALIKTIASDAPDWVIIQYDPFSYSTHYGFNPYLPLAMNLLKRQHPNIKVGLVVHESFIQSQTWKSKILSAWLKVQLRALCHPADVIFSAIQPWLPKLKQWFPNKTIEHLPVSSNIPRVAISRDEARAHLGISSKTIVLGLFGRMQRVRSLEHITHAVSRTLEAGLDIVVLYIGLDAAGARECLGHLPLLAGGPFSAIGVSQRFAAMDIYLLPISEGVSTRRTSLMTALQHGVPTVATFGTATDTMLQCEHGKALLLTDADAPGDFAEVVLDLAKTGSHREMISKGAQELFDREFTWERIGAKFLTTLATH